LSMENWRLRPTQGTGTQRPNSAAPLLCAAQMVTADLTESKYAAWLVV
jgi:hypothetical protein